MASRRRKLSRQLQLCADHNKRVFPTGYLPGPYAIDLAPLFTNKKYDYS